MAEIIQFTGPVLTGPDREERGLWSVDGRLTFRRPAEVPDSILAGWVLPGFVDAHCHIGLGPGGAVHDAAAEEQARTDLLAGTLLVRDAGSPANTRWLQGRADVPLLIRAGRHVARTRRYLRGFAEEVEPEGLVEAVRKQARDGDGWVKLVGDWIDRGAGDLAPSFPAAVVRDAVQAAHDEGARVTAHCFAEETLDDMLDAGIDCVEHATGLLPRHLPRFVEQQVPIVPTLVNIATFPDIAAQADPKFPVYAAHMRSLWECREERVLEAYEAGVRIYAGTDAGSVIRHGRIADEILALHAAGLPMPAALNAACWDARKWLGAEAIGEGARADVVLCREDPRTTPGTIRDLAHVVLGGRIVG
ncbi:amidohydrolase, imidazolonepropionase [Pseudarthrobacter phenanthrenivorans Sphe3]|uniref:Amidohydrolase, imidazolonepropionase n=1 Tax=Pseudarthrobacter phenanthrenivorans (strain DSM 18606 / JCM 16027 / LMG 23796 / Sphe3) TaxID=930171 RepID=F0M525_PSEPM|nr:amidohydrolase family protein [Pseudarthrobacter phenanthrenivorans]ADX73489.1 amidohydrolase, imidazolonepropionase [Pseudarthrobacter phenanthrenivorans Sphe3]